ncbi:hypothetical protein EQG51_02810 [Lactiplantibacillus plantarum]|nr:hypothetical protein EQG51_02810 [Lactiplantibacillus plantarum]
MNSVSEDELLVSVLDNMSTHAIDGEDAKNFIDEIIHNSNFHIRHAQIAKVIYSFSDQGVVNLSKNCQTIETAPAYNENAEKFVSSIRLSIVQRDFILKNIKNAGIEAEKIKDTKSQIYTDVISVLGIFSALIFALFGGLSLLSSISNLVKGVRLSRIILLTSGVSFALIVLIFLLLNGISGMVGKKMKVCCDIDDCKHTIFQKYPFFVTGAVCCAMIMFFSALIVLIDKNGMMYNHLVVVIVAIFALAVVLGIVVYNTVFKKKA